MSLNKILKINIFIFSFVSVLLFIPQKTVFACSCVADVDHEGFADVIFSGTVIKQEDPNFGPTVSSADEITTTFEVDQVFKGTAYTQTQISAARSSTSCGFEFSLNKQYLVYAQEDKDGLSTGLCEGTKLLSEASADLSKLPEGHAPNVGPEQTSKSAAVPLAAAIIMILIAVLVFKTFRNYH